MENPGNFSILLFDKLHLNCFNSLNYSNSDVNRLILSILLSEKSNLRFFNLSFFISVNAFILFFLNLKSKLFIYLIYSKQLNKFLISFNLLLSKLTLKSLKFYR